MQFVGVKLTAIILTQIPRYGKSYASIHIDIVIASYSSYIQGITYVPAAQLLRDALLRDFSCKLRRFRLTDHSLNAERCILSLCIRDTSNRCCRFVLPHPPHPFLSLSLSFYQFANSASFYFSIRLRQSCLIHSNDREFHAKAELQSR